MFSIYLPGPSQTLSHLNGTIPGPWSSTTTYFSLHVCFSIHCITLFQPGLGCSHSSYDVCKLKITHQLLLGDCTWFVKHFNRRCVKAIFYTFVSVGECERILIGSTLHRPGDFGLERSRLYYGRATVCLLFYRNHHYLVVNLMRKCWYTLLYLGYHWQVQNTVWNSWVTHMHHTSDFVFQRV